MLNLNSQSKDFNVVIDEPITNIQFNVQYLLKKVNEYCKVNAEEYYFILHDHDVKDESGEMKVKHIHLLYRIPKRTRYKTELSKLCDFLFGDEKYRNLIQIEKWKYHDEMIQYLTHKNNPEKYQYSVLNVFTSDKDYLMDIMQREIETALTYDDIERICMESSCISEVYKRIGLKNSKQYRHIIVDVFKDCKSVKIERKLKALSNIKLSDN